MAQDDDIKFVKENSIASKPITKKDLEKPELVIGFMKNEKGSDYDPSQKEGNVLTIKKRGDVYDFYRGDELRPSSAGIDADEVLRVLNNRTAGYTYLATSRGDPKLARWRDIDDEDIYTNRLRSDADPTRPLEFIGEKGKPVKGQILTAIELAEKAKAGTLTLGEAIDYGEANADKTGKKSYKPNMAKLRRNIPKLGLNLDMPYKDLKNHIEKFTVEGSPEGVTPANRITPVQNLESILRGTQDAPFNRYGVTSVMEKAGSGVEEVMYPQLAGAGTAGGTQRTGLAGERPMQGLLPKADFDSLYQEALPLIQSEYGQEAADLIEYHKNTANRPEQLLNLKKSDVTVSGDTITVKGKNTTKTDHKGRPPLSFNVDSPMGRLLKRNLDASTTDKLFNVSETIFDNAFTAHISPRLEKFSDVLPLAEEKTRDEAGKVVRTGKAVTSPSAVRSIVPRFLIDEFSINENFVEGLMGHINPSILKKNYAGFIAQKEIPSIIENPANLSTGSFGGEKTSTVYLELLSDEQKQALADEQVTTLIAEEQSKQKQVGLIGAKAEAERVETLAAMSPEDIEQANQTQMLLEQGKAEAAQAGAELRQDQRKNKALEVGRQAMEDLANLVGTDPTKIKTGIASTLATAGLAAKSIPGPVGDLAGAAIDPESFDIAEEKGRQTARDLFGSSPTLEAVGGTAAVAGEMLTGAVADPESARTMGTFAASPLLGMMQQSMSNNSKPGPEPQIQAPPPTQGTSLEAQQATGMVNQARRAAMQGKETSMTGSFLQQYP